MNDSLNSLSFDVISNTDSINSLSLSVSENSDNIISSNEDITLL